VAERDLTVIVLAKAPVPGRVKTRLCPPCTPEQAAALAMAAVLDTLHAAADVDATRHLLVLDGDPGGWVPDGWEVVPQCDGGLDRRLGAAFCRRRWAGGARRHGHTPQLDPAVVARAGAAVVSAPGVGVLGMANDGGFWIVALSAGGPEDFEGVPMSDADTGALQLERLIERGHRVELVESLTDVDSWDEARVVAGAAPTGRFATEVERVAARLG
jgi:glycosyltransferase A (GT-A) superfamily protein (DUF2064 family)